MRVQTFAQDVVAEPASTAPRRVRDLERALQGARAEIARLRRGGAEPPDAPEVAEARALCERRQVLMAARAETADAPAREAWLTTYHAWLRALPPLLPEDLAGASLELRERVRLMEASVLVQSEVLAARTARPRTVGEPEAGDSDEDEAMYGDGQAARPLASSNAPRALRPVKADLLRSLGADPNAVDELAAAAARARARATGAWS